MQALEVTWQVKTHEKHKNLSPGKLKPPLTSDPNKKQTDCVRGGARRAEKHDRLVERHLAGAAGSLTSDGNRDKQTLNKGNNLDLNYTM